MSPGLFNASTAAAAFESSNPNSPETKGKFSTVNSNKMIKRGCGGGWGGAVFLQGTTTVSAYFYSEREKKVAGFIDRRDGPRLRSKLKRGRLNEHSYQKT